jgi:predicted ATPase
MWIKSLVLENVKGFRNPGTIEFSKGINVLVGPNSSGKSTILRALHLLQPTMPSTNNLEVNQAHQTFSRNFVRINSPHCSVTVEFAEPNSRQLSVFHKGELWNPVFRFDGVKTGLSAFTNKSPDNAVTQLTKAVNPQREPDNFLYTFFSRRKPAEFEQRVDVYNTEAVEETFRVLYPKIDRISQPGFAEADEFRSICTEIIGFPIGSFASHSGKQAGLAIDRQTSIPLEAMGEGTINALGLVVNLLLAEGKLFLIEELENDLHPSALKVLIELIATKSATNQFIVSTHNNIVVKHLGSLPSTQVFSCKVELVERIPTCAIEPIDNTPEARLKLLESLGYDLFDFDLWKGYLILEESTAETIINRYLIPTFAPRLNSKLRTIAATGFADVVARFSDFLRLFVFIHKSSTYQDRAWVAVDGDENGKQVVQSLQDRFSNWPPNHFRMFKAEYFESYYPGRFQMRVSEVLRTKDRGEKQERKKMLMIEVLDWADQNSELAEKEFQQSASEVIAFLKEIDEKLSGTM